VGGETNRLFDIQLDLLKAELTAIDSAIRQCDEITKSIKNWAVVTWTASVGLALKEQSLWPFVWVTAVVPLVFWFVDGSFRRIQRSFITRLQQISKHLNSPEFTQAATSGGEIGISLMVMRIKGKEFKNTLLGAMCFRSVALLYLGLIVCSLSIWIFKR